MRWRIALACLLAGSAVPTMAGEIDVRLRDARMHPVANAVVTLVGEPQAPSGVPAPVTRYVDQSDETFVPYVQAVRPGDRVVFRNSDHTRHHVYSFSAAKAFEFMLRPGNSSPPLTLPVAGVIAVGCNIHDHMIAYLVVTDLPAQVSGDTGTVAFRHVPPGRYTVQVWHPLLRPGQAQPQGTVELTGPGALQAVPFRLSLIPDPRAFSDREHLDY